MAKKNTIKIISLTSMLALCLAIVGCGIQPTAIAVETLPPTEVATIEFTGTPLQPTYASSQSNLEGMPDSVTVNGNKVTFTEWGFTVELPADTWDLNPNMYKKTSDFEGFVFLRKTGLLNDKGEVYKPSVGILFYSVPEGTQLIDFSVFLRSRMGTDFPSIDSMFGYEGSEPKLLIPALGYYGHLGEGNNYSVYTIHTVNGKTGVQVSFEIVDSVLEQAKPEFFSVMESMEFTK